MIVHRGFKIGDHIHGFRKIVRQMYTTGVYINIISGVQEIETILHLQFELSDYK